MHRWAAWVTLSLSAASAKTVKSKQNTDSWPQAANVCQPYLFKYRPRFYMVIIYILFTLWFASMFVWQRELAHMAETKSLLQNLLLTCILQTQGYQFYQNKLWWWVTVKFDFGTLHKFILIFLWIVWIKKKKLEYFKSISEKKMCVATTAVDC